MPNLLLAKLHLPAQPGDVAVRQRLLAQLDRGLDKKLTLICAPAGFGKTTLVAFWLRALLDSGAAVGAAWYTLDKTDDNLPTFLGYLEAAIRRADWADLDRHLSTPDPEALVAELAQAAETLPGRLIIVLDDYHFISDQNIHRLMVHLLRYLPATLHLVITARSDPPLGLPQLRGRNQVNELRAHDLALTLAEAGEFLAAATGAAIEPEVARVLWERTEGWAVGLRLAASSLAASTDHGRFIQNFQQHSSRHIVDYLVDEVLHAQPPEVHDFLLATSLLDRLCGDLAAAVTGLEGRAAQAILAQLARDNLFVEPLDDYGEWYRYHSQLRTMLSNHLRSQATPAGLAGLRHRAAAWLAQQDLVAEALPHYLAAGAQEDAAALVERHIPELLNHERWHALADRLASLPEALIQQRPALLLLRAWVSSFDARHDAVRLLVEQAEHLLRQGAAAGPEADALWGQAHALRASAIFAPGPTPEAIAHAEEALRLLPPDHRWPRACALGSLAQWTQARGDYPAARARLEAEIAAAGPTAPAYLAQLYHACCVIAYQAGSLNEFQLAVTRYETAARQLDLPAELRWAQWGLGVICLERNEPEQALKHLAAAVSRPELANFQTLCPAAFALLEACADLGTRQSPLPEASEVLAALRNRLGARPEPANLREVEALEAYWALLNGDLAAAGRWARGQWPAAAPALDLAQHTWIRVRICLALAAPADLELAADLAQHLLGEARRLHNVTAQVSALTLLALAQWQRQQAGPALAALREALALGYPNDRRRTFTQHGARIGEMLRELAREPKYAAMAGNLLAELSRLGYAGRPWRQNKAEGEEIIEPLTEREAEVLALMADGLSNKEIAHRLGISPITVRNHTVNIYGKLQVEGRRQAVDRARRLGFLPAANRVIM